MACAEDCHEGATAARAFEPLRRTDMKRKPLIAVVCAVVFGVSLSAQLSIPEIAYDAVDPIKLPDTLYLGEAVGVATNSKGNIYVYTRTGNPAATLGTRRTFARN